MSARILDGSAVGTAIQSDVAERVRTWQHGPPPGLAVILVGNDPASEVYVGSKIRACHELGITSEEILLPGEGTTTEDVLGHVARLNARPEIDGILVQLPLPKHIDAERVLLAIDPAKDVDGLHPMNLGRLMSQRPGLVPCTPGGVIELLRRSQIEIAGREAVVVGRSDLVGKPLALLLLHRHATVTVCHSRTRDLAEVCRRADILVAAVGKPALLDERYIRPGAVVIDVGVNRIDDAALVERHFPGNAKRRESFERRGYTLIGDVDPRAATELASAYSPVPGGVGKLTIAMLMSNTVTAAAARRGH